MTNLDEAFEAFNDHMRSMDSFSKISDCEMLKLFDVFFGFTIWE